MRSHVLRVALALGLALLATRADAMPAFARKYGMSCSACHVAWPILNQVGESFRDNGYQFNLGKDDPGTRDPSYLPIALRTTPQYLFTRTTNVAVSDGAGGTKAVSTTAGGIQAPTGVDILTGGSITPEISYLLVIAGFAADGTGIESAFVRFNRLGGSPWANLKVGKFELEQPMSAHRGVSLASPGYFVYGAAPAGSLAGFNLADNQVGVELMGHDERSSLRYAIAVTSADGGAQLSKNAWSTPLIWARASKSYETSSGVVPWIKVGLMGALGSWPTTVELDAGASPVPGTGSGEKQFTRYGADLQVLLGHPSTPFLLTLAYLGGSEAAGLAGAGSPSNSFDGGFAEVDWVPWSVASENPNPWMFFGKYDFIRYKTGDGKSDGYTLGARRYLAVGPRASAAIHLELHANRILRDGADPTRAVETTAFMAGVDFDF